MADIPRSQTELIALYATTGLGRITAQNGRDLICSVFGYQAIFPPTANNDSVDTAGLGVKFSIGSMWVNTNAQTAYLCVDDRPTIAKWLEIADAAALIAYIDAQDAITLAAAEAFATAADAVVLAAAEAFATAADAVVLAAAEAFATAADAVVLAAAEAYTDSQVSTRVPTTRTVSTTAPLTGGGSLAGNLTLAISDFVASGASHARGAVPDPGAVSGSVKFLREDGTWNVPPGSGVPTSRNVSTSSPLSGGGDLSADRTIALDLTALTSDASPEQADLILERDVSAGSYKSTTIGALINAGVPSGTIMMYGAAAAPSGWVLCDGTSYLRSAQTTLFAAIGTTFGAVDGTHFTVPDLRGRKPIGAGAGTGLTSRTLGATGGGETQVIGTGHLPPHTHTVTAGAAGAGTAGVVPSTAAGTLNTSNGGFANTALPIMDPWQAVSFIIRL